ncbi:MAG: 2'-5' RNA ligase family protein [Actinomycetota bacterium]
MPRTALIVVVPEAEPLVGEWRAKHDWSAQHGVPAHITLLFPFVPVEEVDEQLLGDLRELFASQPAFTYRLPRVDRFPEVVWLAPEPAEPFKDLTDLIVARYPDYPPYEGIHDEVIHHLTVAEGRPELQDEVDAALTPSLPIEAEGREVMLIVEDASGHWHADERFLLQT